MKTERSSGAFLKKETGEHSLLRSILVEILQPIKYFHVEDWRSCRQQEEEGKWLQLRVAA
jgi:hypothetical protein